MLFNEVYSSYFNTVSRVLEKAVDGELTEKEINRIVIENAFGESILNIPDSLKNGKWRLMDCNMHTPILNSPSVPLTDLQKRWMKALLDDPRIKLFNPSGEGLDNIKPLYNQNMIVYFDRYSDGDDFENPEYINHFRIILSALKNHKRLIVKYTGKQWQSKEFICSPIKLEYSSKDDKFRLKAVAYRKLFTFNLCKIEDCAITDFEIYEDAELYRSSRQSVELYLTDERNALERVMLHFSHLEKKAERVDDIHYRIMLTYDKDDETEMLIRILSFGPMIKVISPEDFVKKLKNRIDKQENCGV